MGGTIQINRTNIMQRADNLTTASSNFASRRWSECTSTITAYENAQNAFSEANEAHAKFAEALASSASNMIEIADCFAGVDNDVMRVNE